MNRTKSSISLRNLANSLKQSIYLDKHRQSKRQFIPLKSCVSMKNFSDLKTTLNNKNEIKNQQDYLLLDTKRNPKYQSQQNTKRQIQYQNKALLKRKENLLVLTQTSNKYKHQRIRNNILMETKENHIEQNHSNMLRFLEDQYIKTKHYIKSCFGQGNVGLKKYHQYLTQIDFLNHQLKLIKSKEQKNVQIIQQFKQRLSFLNQQISSIQINFIEDLAEKQYCQEFLQKYQSSQEHYKDQAKIVILLFEEESFIRKSTNQITNLNHKIKNLQSQFKKWKQQQNLQLKQKRFQNKLKQNRILLMKIQQNLDQITQKLLQKQNNMNLTDSQKNPIRKVRQYICSFFKKYNLENINHISHSQISNGIDIFLCKEGLIVQFIQYMLKNTSQSLPQSTTYSKKLQQYCNCLKKIQQLFKSKKTEINQVIFKRFEQNLIHMKTQKQRYQINRQKSQQKVYQLKQQIDTVLAQDSLSIIQCLNKNQHGFITNSKDGFFNINQIKHKVKQLKLQQVKRIKRVKQIFITLKNFQFNQSTSQQKIDNKKQLLLRQTIYLNEVIKKQRQKIKQIQLIKEGFQTKRSKYQQIINQGILKMKQKDEKQNKLKALEKQIEQLKKSKIHQITQKYKQNKSYERPFDNVFKVKDHKQRLNILSRTKNMWSTQIPKFHPNIPSANEEEKYQSSYAKFVFSKVRQPLHQPLNFNNGKQQINRNTSQSLKQLQKGQSKTIPKFQMRNLMEEKAQNQKVYKLKKCCSTFHLTNANKQNQFPQDEQLLLISKRSSMRCSLKGKQKISQKISQKSSLRKHPKTSTKKLITSKTKLSLSSKNYNFKKQTSLISTQLAKKSTINSIISNKLLKR